MPNVSMVSRPSILAGGELGGAQRRMPSSTNSGKVATTPFCSSTTSTRRGRIFVMKLRILVEICWEQVIMLIFNWYWPCAVLGLGNMGEGIIRPPGGGLLTV